MSGVFLVRRLLIEKWSNHLMQQKLITFAVPCYNSAAYMRHCIETLLSAGEQAEIILCRRRFREGR